MRKTLLYLCFLSLLFSCSPEPKKVITVVPKKDFKKAFKTYFYQNYRYLDSNAVVQKIKLDSVHWINSFYENIEHRPMWINDSISIAENGNKLIEKLSKSYNYGIDSILYKTILLRKLKSDILKINNIEERYKLASEIELLLTNYYMLYGKHLHYGLLDSIDSITRLPRKKFVINMPKYLAKAKKTDSLFEKLFELQPQNKRYQKLQKALVKYLNKSSLSADSVAVKGFRADSVKAIVQSKKALQLHKYLDTVVNDSLYLVALKKFQKDHGLSQDGLIGKHTAMALSKSPFAYYQTLAANLERWRWKDDMKSSYIYVNIPSYDLKVFKNANEVFESRTVVGKFKNQTPEIKDSLHYIIAYPYWNVPRKISVKEIIVKAQRDSTYLKRNNYEVLTHSLDSVNIDSVDWKTMNNDNFNYRIRQKGGSSNALGYVKFIFPNKHAIYLHDTPSKYYFSFDNRARSHGCVRVEKAMELSDYILESDKNRYTIDSIYKFIEKRKEKTIRLKYRMPVYIYYFTAKVDENNNLIFYEDIYGIDKKLLDELAKQKSI